MGRGPARNCYADDVALALAHEDPGTLMGAANALADTVRGRILAKDLLLCDPKSQNFVVSPGGLDGGEIRRESGRLKANLRDMPKHDALIERCAAAAAEDGGELPEMYFPSALRAELPFKYVHSMRALGVIFDSRLYFSGHIEGLLSRAAIRHGVMARLARSTWGLEAGVLRATHSVLLTGLTRYALVTYGSGAYDVDMRRLETLHANIAARRITGISRSARLATLRMAAGVQSVRNLNICQCLGHTTARSVRGSGHGLGRRWECVGGFRFRQKTACLRACWSGGWAHWAREGTLRRLERNGLLI